MADHIVGAVDEITEGDRLLTEIKGREIAVFYIDGEYHAYLNWCPHQGGPICEGGISGKQKAEFDSDTLELNLEWEEKDGVIACPWHDWEFHLKSGEHASRKDIRLPSYPVRVENDQIIITT